MATPIVDWNRFCEDSGVHSDRFGLTAFSRSAAVGSCAVEEAIEGGSRWQT